MSQPQNPNQDPADDIIDVLLPFIALAFVLGLAYFFYYINKTAINTFVIHSAWWMLYPMGIFMDSKAMSMNQIAALNPSQMDLSDAFKVLNYSAQEYAFLLIPLAIYFIQAMILKDIHRKYSRSFNMIKLVENNAEYLPFLRPVINRDKLIVDEPTDKGAWALPVKPIQWVVKNKLLLNAENKAIKKDWVLDDDGMPLFEPELTPLLSQRVKQRKQIGAHLDEEKTKRLIIEQLGGRLETNRAKIADSLKDYEVGILAAALAYGANDKKKGFGYISLMSDTFREGEWDEKTKTMSNYELDIGDAREYVKKMLSKAKLELELELTFRRHGSYFYPWLMAVIENYTLKKGVFNSSLYIFLRPLDNRLFLTLNQTGSQTGWIEAYGIWAHYEMEKSAEYTIVDTDYSVELAWKYLNDYLEEQGWIGWSDSSYEK